jgi:lysophospholipase L1-like esterase
MKRFLPFIALLAWCGPARCETIKIWPVGDEITSGTIPGGYREPLYQRLSAVGYSFQFVGSLSNNSTPVLDAAGQSHHDGYGNMAILGVDWYYPYMLAEIPKPDRVLLLVGTYDFTIFHNAQDQAEAIGRLDTLVTHLVGALPGTRIYVANLLPRGDALEEGHIQALFNPFVPDVVERHAAAGESVSFVNLHSAVTLADLADGLHPNAEGYQKIADIWFSALVPEPSEAVMMLAGLALVPFLYRRKRTAPPKSVAAGLTGRKCRIPSLSRTRSAALLSSF